jgi:hypothetical protein
MEVSTKAHFESDQSASNPGHPETPRSAVKQAKRAAKAAKEVWTSDQFLASHPVPACSDSNHSADIALLKLSGKLNAALLGHEK